MQVWIVERGYDYDPQEIDSVWSSEELAEERVKEIEKEIAAFNKQYKLETSERADYYEYEVDHVPT